MNKNSMTGTGYSFSLEVRKWMHRTLISVYRRFDSVMHRCLQVWAYQGNAQVDDAFHTLLKIGFTIVENCLSQHLGNYLLAMSGHTSFSSNAY